MKYHDSLFGDFRCGHCDSHVSAAHRFSGVNNRNHCPYCLWSRHLDLYAAGDRLSACKGQMKPIGLTMKKGRNKYRPEKGSELMLIHKCIDCGCLSINRIATDDDPDSVMEAFHSSLELDRRLRRICQAQGIAILCDVEIVAAQLFGRTANLPTVIWK